MAEIWRAVGHFVDDVRIDRHARFVGNGRQMEHGVGAAAQRHIDGQRVVKGRFCHDIEGADILFDHFHDLHARVLRQTQSLRIDGWNGTVSSKAHPNRFGQTVHAVCRVHSRAGTAGFAGVLYKIVKLCVVDFSSLMRALSFEHRREADLSATDVTGEHRAARDEDGRQVQTGRRH